MTRTLFSALFAGLLFGFGLALSGMIEPRNIIGFLDFFGDWNPRLLWVMVGAVSAFALCFHGCRKLSQPLVTHQFHCPPKRPIDTKLIIGAIIFGIGWGLAGICPGPGLVLLGTGTWKIFLFVGALFLGLKGTQIFSSGA